VSIKGIFHKNIQSLISLLEIRTQLVQLKYSSLIPFIFNQESISVILHVFHVILVVVHHTKILEAIGVVKRLVHHRITGLIVSFNIVILFSVILFILYDES